MRIPIVIAIRIFRQLTNDKRTIGMIIVVPIIITFVFGSAFQGETYNNPIIIVNLDEGFSAQQIQANSNYSISFGQRIVDHLKNDDRVRIHAELTNFEIAKEFILNKTVAGVIFIPSNLSMALNPFAGLNETIIVSYDEAEPAIGGSILGALADGMSNSQSDLNIKSPISVQKQFAFTGKEIKGLDISLPGVMGYITMFLTLLLTVLLSVREDLEGTKARFFSAPISRWQIVFGYILGMSIFASIIAIVVISVAIFIFSAQITGPVWLVLLFIIYFSIGNVFLALFLSRIARNEFQAVQMAVIVAIPSIAISGFMVPINTLPDFISVFSVITPLTYAISGLKTVMLRGSTDIGFEIFALTVFMVVTFLGAILSSKETIA